MVLPCRGAFQGRMVLHHRRPAGAPFGPRAFKSEMPRPDLFSLIEARPVQPVLQIFGFGRPATFSLNHILLPPAGLVGVIFRLSPESWHRHPSVDKRPGIQHHRGTHNGKPPRMGAQKAQRGNNLKESYIPRLKRWRARCKHNNMRTPSGGRNQSTINEAHPHTRHVC